MKDGTLKTTYTSTTMFIIDKFKKTVEITDPKFIPRVGERVGWLYEPTPTVDDVVYDYEKGIVVVKLR